MISICVTLFALLLTLAHAYQLPLLKLSAKSRILVQQRRICPKLGCASVEAGFEPDRIPTLSPVSTEASTTEVRSLSDVSAKGDVHAQTLASSDVPNRTWENFLDWNVASTFGGPVLKKVIADEDILDLSTKALSGLAWFAVGMGALGTIGFDTKPILSIFSIAGITLGLSLKDAFADIYAGLFVMFTRPFKRGSVIKIAGYEGKVMSMDMRYVRLRDKKGKMDVLVPASTVYKNVVTVVTDELE